MVLVDGLQVTNTAGKGPAQEITVPPRACRYALLYSVYCMYPPSSVFQLHLFCMNIYVVVFIYILCCCYCIVVYYISSESNPFLLACSNSQRVRGECGDPAPLHHHRLRLPASHPLRSAAPGSRDRRDQGPRDPEDLGARHREVSFPVLRRVPATGFHLHIQGGPCEGHRQGHSGVSSSSCGPYITLMLPQLLYCELSSYSICCSHITLLLQ